MPTMVHDLDGEEKKMAILIVLFVSRRAILG